MDLLNHYIQIVLLGIVEGVTEFLPISSTGHLLIAEGLGLGHEPDVFNVVIQAGAILAVVFIYWGRIIDLFANLDKPGARDYLLKIGLAFVVTAVVSLVLIKHFHLKLPETLTPVAWATLIGGLVIFVIEVFAKNLYAHEDISWLEAVLLGLAQVLAAAFPGTSRSGATIMAGLAVGVKRPAATQFSFLLGIPTMFAASALDLWRYRKDLTGADHQLLIDTALGFVVSGVVAFFVVRWLLRFVQSHTFNGFAIYRVILGIVLLTALKTGAISEGTDSKAEAEKASAAAKNAPFTLSPAKSEAATTPTPPSETTPVREAPLPPIDLSHPETMKPASAYDTNAAPTNATPAMPPPTNSAEQAPVPPGATPQ